MSEQPDGLDIADIVEVHQSLALYGHVADAGKHRPVADPTHRQLTRVFAVGAVWQMTGPGGRRYEGIDAISAMFAAPPPHHPPSHHTTNPFVYVEDGATRARSKWLVTDHERRVVQSEYHDVLARGEMGWRILERVVTTLSPEWEPPR